jgi:putative FmdB family regulatory protein
MPRYEYKCKKCDRNFEVVHGIDDNVEACESCGGEVRRVFHPVGIVFKGSGFYATDAKKPSNKPSEPFDSDGKDKAKQEKVSDNGDKKKDEQKPVKPDSVAKSSK